jgi:hypothetical protein
MMKINHQRMKAVMRMNRTTTMKTERSNTIIGTGKRKLSRALSSSFGNCGSYSRYLL